MIPGKKYAPEDFLLMAWRWKWLIVTPAVLGLAIAWAYARDLPNLYRSETIIMIQPPRVREDLVRTTVQASPADRVQTIAHQIMSRTRLEGIITDLNLYPEQRATGLMEDVVERMRTDVSVQVVRGDAFRISYSSDQPVQALKVTERLARLFIDENLRDREMLAQGTSQFLSSQLEDARRRLVEQEKRLEEYRRKHAGELPTQQASNLTAISNAQMQARALSESIVRDKDRLQAIDRMIADLTSPETLADTAVVDPTGATVSGGSTSQQLQAAKTTLAALELRLKPEHPDIARMKRMVRDLEKKVEAEALEAPVSPEAVKPRTPAEIARRNRLRQLNDEAEVLKKNIAAKETEEKRLRDVAAAYQARADAAPTRETELIELMRDYSTVQNLYNSLLSKNEESKLAVNLETRQIGEQFRILDPARLPQRPYSPNRMQIHAVGAAGGLALALGLVFLLEWRDTTLKTDDDVKVALGLPVLALVPVMNTVADAKRRRRLRLALGAAGAVCVVLLVVAVAVWRLRG